MIWRVERPSQSFHGVNLPEVGWIFSQLCISQLLIASYCLPDHVSGGSEGDKAVALWDETRLTLESVIVLLSSGDVTGTIHSF